jgi:TonB family protein
MGHVIDYSAPQPVLFSVLPKARTPWREFVFSSGLQVCAVVFLVWLRIVHPGAVTSLEHTFRSVQLVSTPVPFHNQPPLQRPLPKPSYVVNLDTPVLRLPGTPPRVAKIQEDSAPAVRIATNHLEPTPLNSTPAIPKEMPKVVATNVFSTGSSAVPATTRAADRVQTGGFGDPNGVSAKANAGKAATIAALGSFDLPSGGGNGNGSAGVNGSRGVVASSGFGNGAAIGNGDSPAGSAKAVQSSGFGDADVATAPSAHSHAAIATVPMLPAEILSKPMPDYTAEARSLRVQGEVLLEVVLGASGSLRVVRVVRGLGHGLDDNAVKAAEQIRFKPATRNGQPADSTVVLHIVFQLA